MPGRPRRAPSRVRNLLLVLLALGIVPGAAAAEHLNASVRLATGRTARAVAQPNSEGGPAEVETWAQIVIPRGHIVESVAVRPLSLPSPTGEAPALRAECAGVGSWLGYQVAFVRVLSPAGAPIEAAATATLQIETRPGSAPPPLARQRRNPELEAREGDLVRSTVANPDDVRRFAPPAGRAVAPRRGFHPAAYPDLEGSDVEYVIVTSEALAAAFQELADWKTRRGVPTVVRTIESIEATTRHGSDLQETIRTFLQDAYAKWSVTWVLLGGDTEVIPARFLASKFALTTPELIPSDLYFAGLDGSWNADGDAVWGESPLTLSDPDPDAGDLLAEVYLGRLPVTTSAQVTAFVQKLIAYETPADPTYQATALFLGEVLFPADWTPGEGITTDGAQLSENIVVARVPPAVSTLRLYEDWMSFPGSLPLSRAASLAAMGSGFNILNHVGHGYRYNMSVGDASIVNSDIDALLNTNRSSIVNILNCTSLAFDYSCLGEHFINNPAGGAVAVVGASRSAYPLPAYEYQDDWYALLYQQDVWHLGELFARSRLNQTPLAALESAHRWTHYIYNMLGEPEMTVFDATPAAIQVSYPAGLGLGPQNVTVSVLDGPGGLPVSGARVCLQKGDEDYARGVTGPDGQVVLAFAPESAGQVGVCVSGRNLRMHLGTIPVDAPPAASYVHLESASVDDDTAGGTSGNGNGILDAGETVDLRFTLRNDGGASADSVTGSVSESDAWVNVLSSSFATGAIAPGGSAVATAAVRLQLLAAAPDEHVFDLVLSMDTGSAVTEDRLKREIHAPSLQLVRLQVIDTATGNGNGQIDAGEIFELRCVVKNFGTGRADGVTGVLQTSNPMVTIYQASSPYGTIAPMTEVMNTSLYRLSEDILDVNTINLRLTDSRGRLVIEPFELRGPDTPAIPNLDATTGSSVVVATWGPVANADLAGYHVYRAPAASGPWTRVTVDPTNRTAYFRDDGLAPSTQYWYCVSALDVSGNESPRSPYAGVSTNPPQVAGWPIAMAGETSSSPALGDLDGDGLPEIVQGDSHLYAWHGDGQEIIDADNDAQTWGVFSVATGTVTGSVVLAEIDGTPGLEVFACNWADNSVFAIDGDGTLLWTRKPLNGGKGGYWGTPAAADVDRDGHVDLFAPSQDGYIYGWRDDGSPLIAASGDGKFCTYAAYSRNSPSFGNLDADFELEVVVVDVAGNLYVMNPDGTSLPGFPKAYGIVFNNSPVVGDVDGDGKPEIVAVHTSGTNNLHCLRGDGTELPGFPITVTLKASPVAPTPALADLDADGKLEIVVAGSDYATNSGMVHVFRWDGTSYPGWPRQTLTTSESSPIVADLDGDGQLDIVFGGQDGFVRGWKRDGTSLLGFPVSVGDFVRGTPAVGDVDGDGDVDLVLAGWDKNLWVWDLAAPWNPALAAWPAFLHDAQRTGLHGFEVLDATDAGDPEVAVPRRLELRQNHPNPFNPTTVIQFGSPVAGSRVRLDIFDVRGRHVRRLVDGPLGAGRHQALWDGRDGAGNRQPSGVYFYRLSWDGAVGTRRMLLLQ